MDPVAGMEAAAVSNKLARRWSRRQPEVTLSAWQRKPRRQLPRLPRPW